jgi:hypothetical protein
MKLSKLPLFVGFSLLVAANAFAGEVSDAFVAQTLGVKGVTHIVTKGGRAGTTYEDIEYRDASNKTLVRLRPGTPELYDMWKQVSGAGTESLNGLGTDAFYEKTFRMVCAKSATSAACFMPEWMRTEPKISTEQLRALVKAAI